MPGKEIENTFFRIGEAGMSDMVLDVWPRQSFAASNKAGKHACWHGQHTATGQGKFQDFRDQPKSARLAVDRYVALQPPGEAGDVMVGKILTNTFQGVA